MNKPVAWPMSISDNLWWIHSRMRVLLVITFIAIVFGVTVYKFDIKPGPVSSNPAGQCQQAWKTANPVKAENLCPGTNNWQLDHPTGPEHAIEGFTAPISVNVGENVNIYVSTTASSYTFQVYRMGWYQGLGGHLVYSSSILRGITQPPPAIDRVTRMVSCTNWTNPVSLAIPSTWVSGVYIVKLLSRDGYMRYTYFVVRNDASHSSILFQTSVLTYEAYNGWGGYNLYRGQIGTGEEASSDRAYIVSFDRPFDTGAGLGDFPLYNEYNVLRWLERVGYDVSYTTDVDTDMRGQLLLQHRLFMAVGHDEYWSTAMRDHVTDARDKGVSLAFFGGNDLYWHVRLQSSPLGADRMVICYKPGYYSDRVVDPMASHNRREATVLWRDSPLNEPENALLGEMYGGEVAQTAPLVLDVGAKPFLAGANLHVGSAVTGLIGNEYDRVYRNGKAPSSLSVLASSPLRCVKTSLCPSSGTDVANATLYTTASGASVFDAGTFYWGWGLDDDSFDPKVSARLYSTPPFQQFTANILTYLLKSPID